MRNKGILYVFISALIFGFSPVISALTYQSGNNSISLTFFRYLFASFILAAYLAVKKADFKITLRQFKCIVIIGLSGFLMTTYLLNTSYMYIDVGTATNIHFLYPIFVTLICKFYYRDAISKKQLAAVLMSLLAAFIFIDFQNLTNIKGVLIAMLSGLTCALYIVVLDKTILAGMENFKLTFYISIVVSCGALAIGTATHTLIILQPVQNYVYMLILALSCSVIGIVLLQKGIKILGSSMASMLSLLEPVSSVIFGVWLLNEEMSFRKIAGSFLICFAIAILTLRKNVKSK